MVYAIGLESEFFNGARVVRSRPDRGLRKLAEETGGGYFELKKTEDALGEYAQLESVKNFEQAAEVEWIQAA